MTNAEGMTKPKCEEKRQNGRLCHLSVWASLVILASSFMNICGGHRPPLQQKNDYPGARCRYHGRPADREWRGRGFGKSNYRRWKISRDLRAQLRTHACRSWRASTVAGINQRASPPRLHMFTRSNPAPEIFC